MPRAGQCTGPDVCDIDTDGDGGLTDLEERTLDLAIDDPDTDGDTIGDSEEVDHPWRRSTPTVTGRIHALDDDSDADGVIDLDEAGDAGPGHARGRH